MAKTKELLITRTFDAPKELVWKAWTQPEYLKRWWGPKDFTSPVSKIDFRVGGTYLHCMRAPDGKDYWSTGVYQEIVPGERFVASDRFADKDGNIVPASYYGLSPDFPSELQVTATFAEHKGKTKLTLRHVGFPSGKDLDSAGEGWNQSLDKLAELLTHMQTEATKTKFIAEPGKQEVVITRVFDAPRARVFQAYTDPALIPKWWGLRSHTTTVNRMDVKPGGIWRFVESGADGEYAFHGVYHESKSPERLVYTFEYEGMPGHTLLETVTLEDQGGKTKLTDRTIFQTLEDRDDMLKTGMEKGAVETLDRLGELLG